MAHRARLRAQRAALRRLPDAGRLALPGPDPAAAVGWPAGSGPLDARTPGALARPARAAGGQDPATRDDQGNRRRDRLAARRRAPAVAFPPALLGLGLGAGSDPDRLAARAIFARLWRSWQAWDRFGRGDAWLPYPAALRAWSWCGLHRELVAGSDIEPAFVAGLAAQAGFLRRHLESDVGGNHLVKELKALAGLAVFFADDRLLRRAVRRLTSQLDRQVLPTAVTTSERPPTTARCSPT